MEYLKGQDLQKAARQGPPLTLERKVAIIVQVLAGLAPAHALGIVHRDIKPANVFIQEDGSAKIMDFGVARLATATMTGTGSIVGTADYMSPEQVKGAPVDGRSDLFSVGCMLFELVTGRRPFHSDNLMAIFYKITHDEASFDLVPKGEEHDALLPILKKALAKDVDQRFQTANEFAADLREWLRAHATAATRSALGSLVDFDAPTTAPMAATEVGTGLTPGEGGATVDLGRRAPPPRPPTATARGAARPPADVGTPTLRPGPTRVQPAPSARRRPSARPSALPWVVGGLALVALAGGGVWLWRGQASSPGVVAVDSSPAALPAPTPAPPTPVPSLEPTPSVPTPEPAPTLAAAAGKAAARIQAAQAAFRSGQYDRAVAAAQEALREDPASPAASEVLERSLAGQKAAVSLRTAEAALAKGDLAGAEAALAAARTLAPWDRGAAELASRLEQARLAAQQTAAEAAQRERVARVSDLLNQANTAAAARDYDKAISLFDQVLEVDAANAAAQAGKTLAIGNRTAAEPGARPAAAGRAFVAGPTSSRAAAAVAGGPAGFEDSAGVAVKKATQAALLPGRLVFEPSPTTPKAGERYRIVVHLKNDGQQPIRLASAVVTTTVDGRRASGPVALSTSTVAPGDRAPVFQTPGGEVWRDGIASWEMEVVLRTTSGDTYAGSLSWK
jgi:tetratricopeptide (TPR) repeat protein